MKSLYVFLIAVCCFGWANAIAQPDYQLTHTTVNPGFLDVTGTFVRDPTPKIDPLSSNTFYEFIGPSTGPQMNQFKMTYTDIGVVLTGMPFFVGGWVLLEVSSDELYFICNASQNAFPSPPAPEAWIGDAGVSGGISLPVEFQYFRATPHGTEVKLEWATATESNNKGFEVQHSTDARTWAVLGFEEGFGTTAAEQRYAYWHAAPPHGTHYYRLRQIDYDGAFDYSDIVQVRLKGAGPLQFYPNPAHDHVNIVLPDGTDGQPVHITCTDLLGRTVWQDQPLAAATTHTAYLPTDMPSGVYVIRLRIGQEVWQALLHKQ